MKRCAVCIHPKRCEIERDIIRGIPYATLCNKYSIKEQCIKDHKARKHISQSLVEGEAKHHSDDLAALLEECLEISLGAAAEARASKCYAAVGSIMAGPYRFLERVVPNKDEETGLEAMRRELKERRDVETTTGQQQSG